VDRRSSNVYTMIIHLEPLEINRNSDIPLRFGMPRRRMRMSQPISSILTLKLVAMATSLERSGKTVIIKQTKREFNAIRAL